MVAEVEEKFLDLKRRCINIPTKIRRLCRSMAQIQLTCENAPPQVFNTRKFLLLLWDVLFLRPNDPFASYQTKPGKSP